MLVGTHDCLCPPKDWDSKLYHVSTSSCKYIANIVNGGHCEFCWDGLGNLDCKALVDSVGIIIFLSAFIISYKKKYYQDNVHSLGCIFKDVIGYQQQQTQTMRYLVPYLDWQLKGKYPEPPILYQFIHLVSFFIKRLGIEPQHRKLNSLLQQDIKRNLVQSEFTCQV